MSMWALRFRVMERYWWLVLSTFFIFIFTILFVRFFVISPGRVNGRSMESNYLDEDLFFVNRIVYLVAEPRRFEIVQLVDVDTGKLIIKRIVGLPGEQVEIKRGKVFVKKDEKSDFIELDESFYLDKYTYTSIFAQTKPIRYLVGSNQYFVMGDNREHSTDSRYYGAIGRQKIIGRVINKKGVSW